MPPRSKNIGNTPNNFGNGRNQQDENRDCRHNQGQPPEMIQMMQTLVGVIQQQVTTGDNLARTIEFKRLSPPAFEGLLSLWKQKNGSLRWRKYLEFLNALGLRKWLMQPIYCVKMLMTGSDWKKTNVGKRLSLGHGSYLSLYSMRNIFLKASVFRRKRSLSS